MTEDEMIGWHHRLDRHEAEQSPGVDDGQESSSWDRKELDTTDQLPPLTRGLRPCKL